MKKQWNIRLLGSALLTLFYCFLSTSCWTFYTDNPTYKPEVTNAYQAAPASAVGHVEQWVGQMFDAELSLEILDGKCQTPTIYSDLEFQIRQGDKILMRRQLDKKSFRAKVYLEKGEYRALLISFSRGLTIADKAFLFEANDKRISLDVSCRK